jgi:hypothetical protein
MNTTFELKKKRTSDSKSKRSKRIIDITSKKIKVWDTILTWKKYQLMIIA